jgi:hypothetical protein
MYPFSMPAFDLFGVPLVGGLLQFYLSGTTTPEPIYADVNGTSELTNPVVLDSSGFAPIFLGATLYDVVVYNSLSVQLYSIEGVGDPGQILFTGFGNIQAQGSKDVADGYLILSTDNLVTTPTGATAQTMTLPPASERSSTANGNGLPLIIMNFLSNTCTIEPDGADTINGDNAAIVLAAAANPVYHYTTLYSDGASAWYALTN